jgi:hypothetical protein
MAALMALLLSSCSPGPDPEQTERPNPDDCLKEISLEQLPAAIKRCNAVVAAHPANPQPLNERSLLHSLSGNQKAACADSRRAAALLRLQTNQQRPNPIVVEEIGLRDASCRRLTTPPATGAPSAAAPGDARP